jgi:hypothetical protein
MSSVSIPPLTHARFASYYNREGVDPLPPDDPRITSVLSGDILRQYQDSYGIYMSDKKYINETLESPGQRSMKIVTGITLALIIIGFVFILLLSLYFAGVSIFSSPTSKELPGAVTKLSGLPISLINPTTVEIARPENVSIVKSVNLRNKATGNFYSSYPTCLKNKSIQITVPTSLGITSASGWDATLIYTN